MEQLLIKNDFPVQEDFWGNGAIYHGYAGMPDSSGRVYSEELCELEAARVTDMRLKVARTFYGWWGYNPEDQSWNWEVEPLQAFYRWLSRMKKAGVTVALNMGWCMPGDLESTGFTGISPFTVPGDRKASIQKYADFASETIHQLVELRGFDNVRILTLFTEPQGRSDVYGPTWEDWVDAAKAVHETLKRDGRRHMVRLMGPNEGSTITSAMLKWVAPQVEDVIDIFSSHTYQFAANIPQRYIEDGKGALLLSLAGSRICQNVSLKPHTQYEIEVRLAFQNRGLMEPYGQVVFGVFDDIGNNDIYHAGKHLPGVVDGTIIELKPEDMSEEIMSYRITFNSGDNSKGVFGVFYDIKTPGICCIRQTAVCESETSDNILKNSDFSSREDDWRMFYASTSTDVYDDWYQWTKTGMQYVPQNKQFCFDEYNITYDRDNSRISHGAEVANAAIAMMNAGAQMSLLWMVFDQQWPNNHTTNGDSFVDGDHRCGTMPVLTRSRTPYLSYYAFSLLSRYVTGKGTKVYEGKGERCMHCTMSRSPDDDITIVVVNAKENEDRFALRLEQPLNRVLHRHLFDPNTCVPDDTAAVIGADKSVNVINMLSDDLPAYSVCVYTTMDN